ncbi:hypothetical protein [Rhodoferax mekongensis]|uniref:hypothetical protein n=1 Tax=Rhodoferax mekongensis TaxID=3068341 RepID=UPI0028BF314F|nr:hypothetical protein [Rhodoferax sp. TBRC 17199]MDT7515370.1 hypothetical protein [Rhodoferax sp. TBRC 17199]
MALATVPKQMKDIIVPETGELKGMFAREIEYLVKNNYKPINVSNAQWETIKGWFK